MPAANVVHLGLDVPMNSAQGGVGIRALRVFANPIEATAISIAPSQTAEAGPVKSIDIAHRAGIAAPYLEPVFAGIWCAPGYCAVCPGRPVATSSAEGPAEISLGNIARAVRSPEDQRETRGSSILRRRVLQTVWRNLEEQTSRLMDGVTMEDLRERASATTRRRRR